MTIDLDDYQNNARAQSARALYFNKEWVINYNNNLFTFYLRDLHVVWSWAKIWHFIMWFLSLFFFNQLQWRKLNLI